MIYKPPSMIVIIASAEISFLTTDTIIFIMLTRPCVPRDAPVSLSQVGGLLRNSQS